VSEAGALERDLLQGLLWAYGPSGQEDAVRDVYLRELAPLVDESWVDPPQAMWSS
jgi:putative aminopeptidase FrvX